MECHYNKLNKASYFECRDYVSILCLNLWQIGGFRVKNAEVGKRYIDA